MGLGIYYYTHAVVCMTSDCIWLFNQGTMSRMQAWELIPLWSGVKVQHNNYKVHKIKSD